MSTADRPVPPDKRARSDWSMLLRVAVLGLLATLAALDANPVAQHPGDEPPELLSYWLWLATGYGLSVLLAWWWDKHTHAQRSGWIQLSVDTILAAVVVELTGGSSSEFTLLYPVAIIASATHGSSRQTWTSFGSCALTYASMSLFELLGWLDGPQSVMTHSKGVELLTILRNLGAMTAVALFAQRLTHAWKISETAREHAELRNVLGTTEILRLRKDLEQSERMATIGQLAATVAHEIRNPLASMSGCVELLALPLDESEHKRLREIIGREIRRLDATVQQLLDFSKPKAPQMQEQDLVHAVREVVEAFAQDPRRANLDVEQTGAEHALARFERAAIAQVLWNLLHNAAQAQSSRGRIEVRVTQAEERVSIEVLDEGCGIAPDLKERVFDPYYTTRSDGSGFGLAVVASIVERHQGEIKIDARADKGTVFCISWPSHVAQELAA